MIHLILNDEAAALPAAQQQLISACIEKTLADEAFPYDAEVSFSVTDDAAIRRLNFEQRGIDRATDVLSFPMLAVEEGTLMIEDADFTDDRVFLGDIVISLERAAAQAAEYGHSLERELGFLTVHSTLHLLGYDHEDGPREESEMFQKQEAVLQSLALLRESL